MTPEIPSIFRPDSLSTLSGFPLIRSSIGFVSHCFIFVFTKLCLAIPKKSCRIFGVQKNSLEELPVDANKSPSSISDVVANYQLLCNSFSTENSSVRLGCEGLVGWKPSKWKPWEFPSVNLGNHWNQRWSFLSEVLDFRFFMFSEFAEAWKKQTCFKKVIWRWKIRPCSWRCASFTPQKFETFWKSDWKKIH